MFKRILTQQYLRTNQCCNIEKEIYSLKIEDYDHVTICPMGFEFYRLENGTRVVLVPMEGVQSMAVGVYVATGSRFETPKINGISHFLEHMVFKGTNKFPTHTDTSFLEGLGAIQNAWTDVDATAYWCKVPADKWREALDLMKELALYPTLPEKDLEIERGVILEEINRREDRPDEMVSEELYKLMFDKNPLGMTVLGEPEVIKNVSRQDFVDYHTRQYVTENLVVAVAGKMEDGGANVKKVIEEWFGTLPKKSGQDLVRVDMQQKGAKTLVTKKELAQQAHVEVAFPGLTVADPDRFALSVLTSYLGHGLSSRLFIELREKRGLCYAVQASDEKYEDTGIWGVYAGLNIAKLEDAVEAILTETYRLKKEVLPAGEVEKAKEKLRGPLLFSMENPINQMNFYAKQVMDRPEEILSYEEATKRLMAVDAESIRNVAVRLFKKELLNIAVVGPVDDKRAQQLVELGNE